MCGIAGFFANRSISNNTIDRMLSALKKRGPDAQHVARWDDRFLQVRDGAHSALLHTRLSIRDPRPLADQPMSNPAKDIWICYNGEVYGWERDAKQLARDGFNFRTSSDTEFILHAYEAWGIEELVAKLRGMFALAILDLRTKKLHLVRDRLGLKPLVYHATEEVFAFGSTVRSVLPIVPIAARDLSTESIDAFLAHRYIPAPRTIFKNISRLENGHRLCISLNSNAVESHCYWRPSAVSGSWENSLDESIALRTASDRPVGLFLSGGVDSAVIATRLCRMGYGNIATFTAAFPGSKFDESAEAAALAGKLGMTNRAVTIEPDLERDFVEIVRDLDEPFADPSAIPTWYLARETAREVTVVLGGDGGDELFGGYKRYRQHLRSAWRRGMNLKFPIRAGLNYSRIRKIAAESAIPWDNAYALRFSGFAPWQRAALITDDSPRPIQYWRGGTRESYPAIDALLGIDFDNYLPEYILRKADLCTMAHGLELRAPLLDHIFVQHIWGLDSRERFTNPPKSALISVAPEAQEALMRKKRGFNPPIDKWLLNDLRSALDDLGSSLSSISSGFLDRSALESLVNQYRSGHTHLAEQLLQLLILAESIRQLREIAAEQDG